MEKRLKKGLSVILAGSLLFGMVCNAGAGRAAGRNAADDFRDNFIISPVVAGGEVLPNSYGGGTVSWSGTGVSADGKVLEAEADTDTKLKATFNEGGAAEDKEFSVKILGRKAYKLEAYTREPLAGNVYSGKLAYSMHLAVNNGNGYSALYDNCGLLYARAVIDANGKLNPKNLNNPYVFHMKDNGMYGIVAVRTDSAETADSGRLDDTSRGKVLLFTTADFIHYEERGLIDLGLDVYVSDVRCDYDSALDTYVIRWRDTDGQYYRSTAADLMGLKAETGEGSPFEINSEATGIEGANERNYFYVPETVGSKLVSKFSTIYNTDVDIPELKLYTDDGVQAGLGRIKSTKAKLIYSDGSKAEKKVEWNTGTADLAKEGEYYVKGYVQKAPAMKASNNTSLGVQRADPCIYYNDKDGCYYFIATDDSNSNVTFGIRKSETIEGLREAEESVILTTDDYDDVNMCLWAPEFHVIGGYMYIFFAANPAGGWNVQSYVMKLSGDDMTKKESWDRPIRFLGMDGQPLTNACSIGGITLDMTSFEHNGRTYVCWTQRDFGKETGSIICIATIDPNEPWKLTSEPVLICRPDYGWDNNDDTPVDEGPYAIITDKNVFITFSGSSVGATYCVGMLKADADADLLKEDSWTKSNYPILYPRAVEGEAGPGHNSYTTDEAGNLVFVYHARPVDDRGNVGTRNTGLRTVHFDIDGEPVLYMYGKLELNEKYEEVTMKVVVTSKAGEDKKQQGQGGTQGTQGSQDSQGVQGTASDSGTQTGDNLKTGSKITVGKYIYRIIKADNTGKGRVAVAGTTDKKLKKVVIGDTVLINKVKYKITEIGNGAFKGCRKLKKITIGKNMEKIGSNSFTKCGNLQTIVLKGLNVKKAAKNSFNKIHKNAVVKAPKKAVGMYKKLFKNMKVR